jgi:hypothetical protein
MIAYDRRTINTDPPQIVLPFITPVLLSHGISDASRSLGVSDDGWDTFRKPTWFNQFTTLRESRFVPPVPIFSPRLRTGFSLGD